MVLIAWLVKWRLHLDPGKGLRGGSNLHSTWGQSVVSTHTGNTPSTKWVRYLSTVQNSFNTFVGGKTWNSLDSVDDGSERSVASG